MGLWYSTYISHPDTAPNTKADPTFDPLYGFPNGRKVREMKVTEEEMEAAGLPPSDRGYCAHLYIDFLKCRRENFPWVLSCKHQKHLFDQCEFDDFVLRMKEYERERRLLERAKKKHQTQGHSEVLGS